MRSWFAILMMFVATIAGWSCQQREPSVPSLDKLVGFWVNREYLNCLSRTKSVQACIANEPAFVIIRDSASYIWSTGGFHETLERRLRGIIRVSSSDTFQLDIDYDDPYVLTRSSQLFIIRPDMDSVLVWIQPEDSTAPQEYILVDSAFCWERIFLAGVYADSLGRSYSFGTDGIAHWPDSSFKYELALDLMESTCDYIRHSHARDSTGYPIRNAYRFSGDTLILSRVQDDEDYVMHSDSIPFLLLKRTQW